jgi:hypothetical protein
MPREDGFALRDAIEAIDPGLARRMTLLTGALTQDAERRAFNLGLRVFSKPIDVTSFLAYCDEHIPRNAPA